MNSHPRLRNPRRRRLRVPLLALLAVVAVAALPMAWVRRRVQSQRRAVAAVLRHGGTIDYDFQRVKPSYWDSSRQPPALPPWLRWLPIECFQDAEVVMLPSGQVTDRDLDDMSGLGRLQVFKADGRGITDAGVARLCECSNLEVIVIMESSITDEGVARLSSLKRLRLLHLSQAPITDRALDFLGRMPRLEGVGLPETRVTVDGMERWKRLHPKVKAFR